MRGQLTGFFRQKDSKSSAWDDGIMTRFRQSLPSMRVEGNTSSSSLRHAHRMALGSHSTLIPSPEERPLRASRFPSVLRGLRDDKRAARPNAPVDLDGSMTKAPHSNPANLHHKGQSSSSHRPKRCLSPPGPSSAPRGCYRLCPKPHAPRNPDCPHRASPPVVGGRILPPAKPWTPGWS